MSLHDKLAQKAIAMGRSSSEFTAAAQKHANASWFYVIAAGYMVLFWMGMGFDSNRASGLHRISKYQFNNDCNKA